MENRSIKFSRADKVNDLDEVAIIDAPEIKKSVFISCWTAKENESIPLWALYGSKLKGVRICLSSIMFEGCSEPYQSKCGKYFIVNLYSFNNSVGRKTDLHWIPYLFGPSEVKYTNKNEVSVLDGQTLDVSKIGTIKLKHWTFEEEHRYIIFPNALWNPETESFQFQNDIINNPIVDESIHIKLNQKVLDNIEIKLGPDASDSEWYIVNSLLKKYTKNGNVDYSDLSKHIKISL